MPPTDVIELVAEIAVIAIDPKMEEERRQPKGERRMVEKRVETRHQALYLALTEPPPRLNRRRGPEC